MATKIKTPPADVADEVSPLVDQVAADPKLVLIGKVPVDEYLAALKASVDTSKHNIDTKAGQDRIRSDAAAIVKHKTAIDAARKALTEDWRRRTSEVNEAGKAIVPRLADLAAEIRRPLTDYEAREDARIAEAGRVLDYLREAGLVRFGEASEAIAERLDAVRGMNLNDEVLGVRLDMAIQLRDDAVKSLTEALTTLRASEAQAAELARLRADAAAAEQRRLADEQARRDAEIRAAAEQAEADRIERIKVEAAEQAKADAERQARAEQEARDADARAAEAERERQRQAEIDAANERARQAEEAAAAERQRIADEQAAHAAAAEAERAERERRENDRAHKVKVKSDAKAAIMSCGTDEDTARKIVIAIMAGEVPHITITF